MKNTLFLLLFAVASVLSAQSLDTSFAGKGFTIFNLDDFDKPTALAAQPDGKLLAGGDSHTDIHQVAVVKRFLADGSPDLAFAQNSVFAIYYPTKHPVLEGIALYPAPDGRIVLAGNFTWYNDVDSLQMFVVRLMPDGSRDLGFGLDGLKVFPKNGQSLRSVAVDAAGKIVLAGKLQIEWAGIDADFMLKRLNADGSPDTGFGAGGTVFTDFEAGDDHIEDLLIEPDGRLTVCGAAGVEVSPNLQTKFPNCAMARYLNDGTLDPSFGDGGKMTAGYQEYWRFGRLMRWQSGDYALGFGEAGPEPIICGLAKVFSNGTVDTSFGKPTMYSNIKGLYVFEGSEILGGMALFGDKIMVSHSPTFSDDWKKGFSIQRFDETGKPDQTFGDTSFVFKKLDGKGAFAFRLAVLPDACQFVCFGVVADTTAFGDVGQTDFALARFLFDGSDCTPVAASEPNFEKVKLTVSPNPASDFVEISMPTKRDGETALCTIYDATGRPVISQKGNLPFRFNLENWPPGIWFAEVRTERGAATATFVTR